MSSLDERAISDLVGTLERELADRPSPRVFAPLAEAYRMQGRLEDAARIARSGLADHPRHVGVAVVLARVLLDAGRADEAREAYEAVRRLDPANAEASAFLAPSASAEQQPPRAVKADSAPLEGLGTLSRELDQLADLFSVRVTGGHGGADDELDGIATLTLAEIYAKQGLHEKAVEVCERMLERNPGDEEVRGKLEAYKAAAVDMT
jgi:pentatricopeptide repeat protein